MRPTSSVPTATRPGTSIIFTPAAGSFEHHSLDIRDRPAMAKIVKETRPDLIIHCAAQPSHDLASSRPSMIST